MIYRLKQTINLIIFVTVIAAVFGGCKPKDAVETTEQPANQAGVSLEKIREADELIVVTRNNELILIDPANGLWAPFYTMTNTQTPPRLSLKTFQLSFDRRDVVWYAPAEGLLAYNFDQKTVRKLYQPSEWFNTNPYFVFHPTENKLYLVDKEGLELVSVNLTSQETNSVQIPYPFGTVFHLSPDASNLVFISGYKQDTVLPQYMFTTIDAMEPIRFVTGTELADRHLISWLPDSSGIVVIEEEDTLMYYPLTNPEQPQVFYNFDSVERIVSVELVGNDLYVRTNADAWYVIDGTTKQLTGRVPVEIAQELNQPVFIPWSQRRFLLEEVVRSDKEHYFYRLWLSDFLGIKTMVIPEYQNTTITSMIEGL